MNTKDKFLPITRKLNIFPADDDNADCLLFKEALKELPVSVQLTTFNNREQLMERLTKKGGKLPDVLFPGLKMPRKDGPASLAIYEVPALIAEKKN